MEMKSIRISSLLLAALGLASCNSGPVSDVSLDAPPDGEGFQYETGEFEVPAGTEEQDCYFYQIPGEGTDPVYINKIEVAQTAGSHHMNIFRVKTIAGLDPANGLVQTGTNGVGECFVSTNWADWPLVINSQIDGNVDWTLPEGVAHKFTPGDWIMLQTHFVNATTQETPKHGEVFANFWITPASAVVHELGTLFATKQSIRICESNPEPSFDGTCQFNSTETTHIIGANAHFHSRGKQFDMYSWDGTSATKPEDSARFYRSDTWDDPPMKRSPDLDLQVPAGGGVWYTCSYEWQTPPEAAGGCDGLNTIDSGKGTPDEELDCCYRFGGLVDPNEHCNIFVYYYPKADDVTCF